MSIFNDEQLNKSYAKLSPNELIGFKLAINILIAEFPKIDIYKAIVGGAGAIISAGCKPIDNKRGTPLFGITKPKKNKPSHIKIRIDSTKDKKHIKEAFDVSWQGFEEKFYLNDLESETDKFKSFLNELKSNKNISDIIVKRSNGNGYNFFDNNDSFLHIKIDKDDNSIDKEIGETYKKQLIKARRGQGPYRDGLISLWKGCSVTGYKDVSMLVASHIKPWCEANNSERLDPYNGLLLLPNLDKAFDSGLITFDLEGKIKISSLLDSPNILGINDKMKVELYKENIDYIVYHNKHIFKS